LSPLIKLNNVTKIYQTGETALRALNDVSLSISEHEFVAIMGGSGSGKSTMMNILGLLDHPTSGSYFLSEKEVTSLNDDERAYIRNRKIGFIFQLFFLLPRLNAEQNVMLPLLYRGIAKKEAQEYALAMLEKVHIAHLHHHKPNQMSGGEQQRVAIARALVGDPSIILADEPTGALDSKTSQDLMKLFFSLYEKEKKTIAIVTHDPKVAKQCKRIITIEDGKIIGDES
jgi:putative ABC transport system ATP-binding protein